MLPVTRQYIVLLARMHRITVRAYEWSPNDDTDSQMRTVRSGIVFAGTLLVELRPQITEERPNLPAEVCALIDAGDEFVQLLYSPDLSASEKQARWKDITRMHGDLLTAARACVEAGITEAQDFLSDWSECLTTWREHGFKKGDTLAELFVFVGPAATGSSPDKSTGTVTT